MTDTPQQPLPDLLGFLPDNLGSFLAELGEPKYRAKQLFSWLQQGASFEEMSDLPKKLRERLPQVARAGTLSLATRLAAEDGTEKFGFSTHDDHTIETVLLPYRARTTVCVSSQIGCAYRCRFCETGKQGLTRNLTAGEIVEQIVFVGRADRRVSARCKETAAGQETLQLRSGQACATRVSNVVFMGMGEPLANYEKVLKAVRILNQPEGLGIGARHIAISTCGLPDEMRRLAEEGLQLALAVSLHGATNEVREQLVPINRRHTIAAVMAAAKYYASKTGRKISFEYVVVPELNDTFDQADALAKLLQGFPNMVNLIPRSPLEPGVRTDPGPAHRFAAALTKRGIEAAVRRSRGAEVLGACGQLSSRTKNKAG